MEFKTLDLVPELMQGIEDAGFVTATPVQEAVMDFALKGEDVAAQSQTGTGKTAAFLIPIFQRIMTDEASRKRKVLILAPTRELAVQIEAEAHKIGSHLPISTGAFYGGVGYGPQFDMLRDDVQFIIGTPGRIIDLVEQGKMILRDVGFLVIDEADRMFDMGFIDDLRKLIRYLPDSKRRQTFLFSATLGFRIKNLAWEYMEDPKEVLIEPEKVTVELVTQELYHVASEEKFRLLLGLLEKEKAQSVLIFCNQKYMVEQVAKRLTVNGIDCDLIMGDLPQSKRLEVINKLKNGQLEILVATDVAARGLDIQELDLVVNYDLPEDIESYVHRIGRTARAGRAGKAITLACEKFVLSLPAIEEFIGQRIPVLPYDDSLLPEDKSAHMRHSSSRDRDRGDRPGSRDRARTSSRDGGRYGSRSGARSSGRSGGAERGTRSRPEGARERPEARRPPRREDAVPEPRQQGGADPYKMSSEERMRRYKDKYAKAPPSRGEREGTRTDAPRADDRGRARSGGAPGGRAKAGGERQGQRPATKPEQRASKPPVQKVPTGKPLQGGVSGSKKPGILERLKRILGLDSN